GERWLGKIKTCSLPHKSQVNQQPPRNEISAMQLSAFLSDGKRQQAILQIIIRMPAILKPNQLSRKGWF
ncbi:MAG: hypothetical protein WCF54_08895, partial [Terracidiphilus sp.]